MTAPHPQDGAPPPPPAVRIARNFLFGLLLVAVGLLFLSIAALIEAEWAAREPWSEAVLAPSGTIEQEDGIPVSVRYVPKENYPEVLRLAEEMARTPLGREFIESSGMERMELVVSAPLTAQDLAPLIASGRMPANGSREVLAGDLTRLETFEMDGNSFEVVGRLRRGVAGFAMAYLVLSDPAEEAPFSSGREWDAWEIYPEGVAAGTVAETDKDEKRTYTSVWLGTRMPGFCAWPAFAGLMFVAAGGALAHIALFRLGARRNLPVFGPLLQETVRRPRLFLGMHAGLYGLFFAAMVAGMCQPLLNYHLMRYMTNVFTEGGLSYIGDAYESGSILRAAVATFRNNYLMQTLGLTFMISIVPFALGVLKTALSFAVVGFAMAPMWTGTVETYVFHSITMVLEFEAYILASFVVVVWPIRLLRAIIAGPFRRECMTGVDIFVGGIALTAVMLAIAALYEAATLILLT